MEDRVEYRNDGSIAKGGANRLNDFGVT